MGYGGALLFRVVLALWVGGTALFTFIVTPTLLSGRSSHEAGTLIDRLMRGYYLYNLALAVAGTVVLLLLWAGIPGLAPWLSLALLVLAVVAGVYINLSLFPKMRKARAGDAERGEAAGLGRFGELHRLSTSLNLALLLDGIVLLALEPLLRT